MTERSRSSKTFLDEVKHDVLRLREDLDHRGRYSTFDDWHTIGAAGQPVFQNGWLNYNTAQFVEAGFWKDSSGLVHMRGLIRSGSASTIFVLPAGYRPGPLLNGATGICPFGVHAGGGEGRIDIYSTGNVNFVGGSNAYVSLWDITPFRAQL